MTPPAAASAAAGLAGALFALSWLLPVRRLPWLSFEADLCAAAALACLLVPVLQANGHRVQVPRTALAVAGLALVPLAQWACGLIVYRGDAVLTALYLCGLSLAIVVGAHAGESFRPVGRTMAWALAVAGVCSALLALRQWLEWPSTHPWVLDMTPGTRPGAQLLQPNLLATLLLLAIGAVAVLADRGTGAWRRAAALGAVALMALALVVTQSRTGVLALAGLAAWGLAVRRRAGLRDWSFALLVVLAAVLVGVAARPGLSDWLGLTRLPSARVMLAETRPVHWATLVDALRASPVQGYGWNQVALAQAAADLDHPSGEFIEHSHNLVLDLLVWNGLPLGLAIVAAMAAWALVRVRRCRDPGTAALLGVLLVLGVHAMTEFPLDYFGFLMAFGLAVGAIEQRTSARSAPTVPRVGLLAGAWGVLLLVGIVVLDHARLAPAHAAMRADWSAHGPDLPTATAGPVLLLTQLQSQVRAMRSPITSQATLGDVDELRNVARRYAFAPVLLRLALVDQRQGRPALAQAALDRLCRLHPPHVCERSRAQFNAALQPATIETGFGK